MQCDPILRYYHYDMNKPLISPIILNLILIAFSLIRFPTAGLLNASPVIVLLILYGMAVRWVWIRMMPPSQSWGLRLGAIAGLILGGEVLLEYILLPKDNSFFGLVEYGLFLVLLIASGLLSYKEHRSLKGSAQAGLWTGMIGSLIWYGMVMTSFHLFWGTTQQTQVFLAEGNMEDFTRSGMQDFSTFIVQDFFGAGFFHLLLGGVIGSIVGLMGGVVGKIK